MWTTDDHTPSLYQFEMVAEAETSGAVQRVCYHTVERRYSEFLNLQTRLEEKPEVKKLIKSETSPPQVWLKAPSATADHRLG